MTKRTSPANGTRGNGITDQSSAFTGSGPDFAMVFESKDVAEISLPSLEIPEASKPATGMSNTYVATQPG